MKNGMKREMEMENGFYWWVRKHGEWRRTLAMKNGHGNGMLYRCTIDGIQNLFRKGGGR